MSTATQIRPVNVWAQRFAGHFAMRSALDCRAVLSRNVAALLPVTDGALDDADSGRQHPDASDDIDSLLERFHSHIPKHVRDTSNFTNVLQVSCLITNVKTFGERLKYARELRGLTQKELAGLSGVKQSAIGNYESGWRKSAREIVALAAALRVRPEWLVSGKGHMELSDDPAPVRISGARSEDEREWLDFYRSLQALPDDSEKHIMLMAIDGMKRQVRGKSKTLRSGHVRGDLPPKNIGASSGRKRK